MARIRTIKPEFFTSEQVVECSTNARLLFVGLWCFSDDGGRHPASTKRLKMEVFPGDGFSDSEIEGLVEELVQAGLLSSYLVGTQGFWQITGWHHQRIDRPTYRYPTPQGAVPNSESPRRALDEPSPPESSRVESSRVESNGVESKGRESKGVDVESSRKESTRSSTIRLDSNERRDLETVSWEKAKEVANRQLAKMRNTPKRWEPTATFREKLLKAAAVVAADLAPESWLADAVSLLLEAPRRSPANYLGKVLANTLPQWDAYQRAITIPKPETKGGDA